MRPTDGTPGGERSQHIAGGLSPELHINGPSYPPAGGHSGGLLVSPCDDDARDEQDDSESNQANSRDLSGQQKPRNDQHRGDRMQYSGLLHTLTTDSSYKNTRK